MTILLVKGPNVEKQSAWKITDGSKGNWTKKKERKNNNLRHMHDSSETPIHSFSP